MNQAPQVAFIIAAEFEDLEHHVPRMRLIEAGFAVVTAAKETGAVQGKGGTRAEATLRTSDLRADDFVAAVVPGGWAPDKVRRDRHALNFLRQMHEQGKILGFICHAGWVAASANLIKPGQAVTGSLGIRDDLEARGAIWRDEPAFSDGLFVWGRIVADIPAFNRELTRALQTSGDRN